LEETDPERDGHHDEAERLKAELVEVAARIRRQVSTWRPWRPIQTPALRSAAASASWRR
jgi:hypothetical protein